MSADNATTQRLLPCPFCGSINISPGEVLIERPHNKRLFKQTACADCGACGPETEVRNLFDDTTPNETWNKRV